jgi:hypothetical protein
VRQSAAVLALGCALLQGTQAACSREDDQPKATADIRPGFARQAPAAAVTSATSAAKPPPKDEPWPGDVDAAASAPYRMMITRTITVDAGTKAAPPPAANPDDAILERARVAAGGCFASLPAGDGFGPPERSAHIVFTIVPSGTVTRADVTSADTPDEAVLGCIRQQATQTVFSDNGGGRLRTYAIDVRVIAKGTSGGR